MKSFTEQLYLTTISRNYDASRNEEPSRIYIFICPERKLSSQRPIYVLVVLFSLAFYAILAKPSACVRDKRKKIEGHPLKSFFSLSCALFYYRCHPENLLYISSFSLSLFFSDHVTSAHAHIRSIYKVHLTAQRL